jgi:23S rRNA pseudouridine1911/1915/1917 synthase
LKEVIEMVLNRVEKSQRLDSFLTDVIKSSRNQVENLIKKGAVRVNSNTVLKKSFKLKEGDEVEYEIIEAEQESYEVDFDVPIIYEDDDILVINKPANLVVHKAPSVKEATLVDWLKSKNISLSTISGELRHGIVHRLDKGTSGVMVVAKNNESHQALAKQLEDKSMGRYYLAVVDIPLKENLVIERKVGRDPNNRLKMKVISSGKEAKSAFCKLSLANTTNYELISAKLFTGRTHQIRVHLNSINRVILGDTLYGFKSQKDSIKRVFLHAYLLYLKHPKSGELLKLRAELKDDMQTFLEKNFNMESINEKINSQDFESNFDSLSKWLCTK